MIWPMRLTARLPRLSKQPRVSIDDPNDDMAAKVEI